MVGNLSYRSGPADEKQTLRVAGGAGANHGKWKVIEDDNFAISTGNFSQNQFYPTGATTMGLAGQNTTIKRTEDQ